MYGSNYAWAWLLWCTTQNIGNNSEAMRTTIAYAPLLFGTVNSAAMDRVNLR